MLAIRTRKKSRRGACGIAYSGEAYENMQLERCGTDGLLSTDTLGLLRLASIDFRDIASAMR
jgi:hypothetical protein